MKTKRLVLTLSMLLGFVMTGWGQRPIEDGENTYISKYSTISQDDPETPIRHKIYMEKGSGPYTVRLQDLNIKGNIVIEEGADVTIEVMYSSNIKSETNEYAAIDVAPGATLTLTGSGKLIVEGDGGSQGSAGIGGNADRAFFGNIIIDMDEGGSLTATGGGNAAGIGGGWAVAGSGSGDFTNSSIHIKNGTVEATGGTGAADIGVGPGGTDNENVTIIVEGGTVDAKSSGSVEIGKGEESGTRVSVYVLGGKVFGKITTSLETLVVAPNIEDFSGTILYEMYINGIVFTKDATTATLKGHVVLPTGMILEIPEGNTLEIPAGGKLEIPDGTFLVNNGTITNNGEITGEGVIIGNVPSGWTGNIPPSVSSDGTYQIGSLKDLLSFTAMVNAGCLKEMDAVLTADINAEGNWIPIGTEDNPYTGTFDGQGHAVTVHMNRLDRVKCAGFFGCVQDATIKELTVEGLIFGTVYAGGIVGLSEGKTTITGCRSEASVECAGTGEFIYSGGICGFTDGEVTIENCQNYQNEGLDNVCSESENYDAKTYSGGICGFVREIATIKNCRNTMLVHSYSGGSSYSGGIVGWIDGKEVVLYKNYNIGTINESETRPSTGLSGICSLKSATTASIDFCYYLEQGNLKGVVGGEFATVQCMTEAQFHYGEVASLLGEAFGQDLGDPNSYPVLLSFLSEEEKEKIKPVYAVTTHVGDETESGYYNTVEQIETPTKEGHRFIGWFTDETGEKKVTELTPNATLYARFATLFGITISVNSDGGGTVTSNVKEAVEGETVTLTVTPDANYKLGTITVKDATGNEVSCTESGNVYTFPMPASAVTVTATFTPNLFDIAIGTFTGGTVAADKAQAPAGETVTLTVAPANDYNLGTLTVTGATVGAVALSGSGNTYTFVMPAEAVTVAATFSYDPPYVPSYYDLEVEPCEGVTLEANRETVVEGSSFTLTAEVAEGYDAETLVVEFKRGRRGTWKAVKADSQGRYRIGSVYTDIYVRATIAKEEDPTAVESVESDRPQIRAIDGRLCITLASPTDARICDLSGRLVRTARLSAGYNEVTGLPAGVYIVVLPDGTREKAAIR